MLIVVHDRVTRMCYGHMYIVHVHTHVYEVQRICIFVVCACIYMYINV